MKESNIVTKFGNGWIVGLSDGNRIIVESPSGETVEPYTGSCGRILGLVRGDEIMEIRDTAVIAKVRDLWARKNKAYESALAAGDIPPVDGDLSEAEDSGDDMDDDGPATLESLGFDGDTVRVSEI